MGLPPALNLSLSNCRAISRADIALDGITLLCGINATGKSTIAKVLQDAIEFNLYFHDLLRFRYLHDFSDIFGNISSLQVNETDKIAFNRLYDRLHRIPYCDEATALQVFSDLSELIAAVITPDCSPRVLQVFAVRLQITDVSVDSVKQRFEETVEQYRTRLVNAEKESLTYDACLQLYASSPILWQGEVSLVEAGEPVFAYRGTDVSAYKRMLSVNKVFYIESPLVSTPVVDNNQVRIRKNIRPIIENVEEPHSFIADFAVDLQRILGGRTVLAENGLVRKEWMFETADTKRYPLRECATGIKSFSILEILNRYGCLTPGTVLIIDEPEVHLHPQWIVEYARLLVLLAKNVGVKVLIASHSPAMVRAVVEFVDSLDFSAHARIYQAVTDGKSPDRFSFVDRNMDIGEIFDSFNVSYERTAQVAEQLRERGE